MSLKTCVLTNSMRCEASGARFERESAASRCRQGTLDRIPKLCVVARRSTAEPGSVVDQGPGFARPAARVLASLRAAPHADRNGCRSKLSV
jgi:hypothetical protein